MGRLTNLNPSTITDSDIPSEITRDNELTAAINAHLAAADPHSQYLLPAEGDARYRLNSVALTDSDIPSSIARDSEVTSVLDGHITAADPHPQYALFTSTFKPVDRTGSTSFDFNTWSPGVAFAGRYVDNATANANRPAGSNYGSLFQFDPLFNATGANLFKVQILISPAGVLYKRGQNNGTWSPWS